MAENTMSKWVIDPNHSLVQFKVKHLALSNVSGTFKIFSGNVKTEKEGFNNAEVYFEIDTDSIDTNNSERDSFLKSPQFFNAEIFPKISFNGSLQEDGDTFQLLGELTILETTKNIKMATEYTGLATGRFGDTRAGFEVNGKINRKEFGLNFNLLTEAGSLVVGEEIKLHFDIQLIRQ
jgi:polyisoprenoid-binding protein YceI